MYYAKLAHHAIGTRKFLRDCRDAIKDHRFLGMHCAADHLCRDLYEGECQLRMQLHALLLGVKA
jgi:hypothetical protein